MTMPWDLSRSVVVVSSADFVFALTPSTSSAPRAMNSAIWRVWPLLEW